MTFPASLRRISHGALCECKHLRTVKFSEGLAALGTDEYDSDGSMFKGVFEGSALENVELPKTLKRIEYNIFEDCKNLKSILLPGGLEFIGEKAFYNAGLASVSIPKSVAEIADCAFYKNRLRRVTFEEGSGLRSVGDNAFGENDPLSPDEVEFPRGAQVSDDVFEEKRRLAQVYRDMMVDDLLFRAIREVVMGHDSANSSDSSGSFSDLSGSWDKFNDSVDSDDSS